MKSPVRLSLSIQLLLVLPTSLITASVDKVQGYSLLLGAVIYILPNLYFTAYAFRYRGAQAARLIAHSFSWGESGKLALAAVGFALAFKFVNPLHTQMLFAGFISMVVLQIAIGIYISKSSQQSNEQACMDKHSNQVKK